MTLHTKQDADSIFRRAAALPPRYKGVLDVTSTTCVHVERGTLCGRHVEQGEGQSGWLCLLHEHQLHPPRWMLAEVHQHLTGATPAIIGEAVMLSKIAAVTDGRKITATDLMIAARGLQRQRELAEPVFKEATQADKLAEGLGGVIKEALD